METSSVTWVLFGLGLVVSVFSGWQLLGRGPDARAWLRRSRGLSGVHTNVFAWPGFGALALASGLVPVVDDIRFLGDLLTVLSGIVIILALFVFFWWGLFQFPFPLRLVPRWARDEVRRRKEASRR